MTVTLRSPALGLAVGATYSGPEEAWLLAEGYAFQTGYTGPGVSNTGATDVTPGSDPTLESNREAPPARNADGSVSSTGVAYDFDPSGADNDPPSSAVLSPTTGPLAGGTRVTITGTNLAGVTSVTFGGTAGTALDVTKAKRSINGEIKVTTPAGTAGAKTVVLVDPSGNLSLPTAFTYA